MYIIINKSKRNLHMMNYNELDRYISILKLNNYYIYTWYKVI